MYKFSNINCHLRFPQQSVAHSQFVRHLDQATGLHLKIVQHHQHQPNTHSNGRQHAMNATTFHPNTMFWPDLCDFADNIFDDSYKFRKSNREKSKTFFIKINQQTESASISILNR